MSAWIFGTSLVPETFDWSIDAVGHYVQNHDFYMAAAVFYFPLIFGLQWYMSDKDPWDLGGGKSKRFNLIFWWELTLAVFSVVGACHVVPLVLEGITKAGSVQGSLCETDFGIDPRSLWGFLFSVSKVFEFGDTIFIVLRKKPLIFLQYYHHLCTMVYCWYGLLNVAQLNNSNHYFAAMNLCVHSVMYSWFAATRTGWRSPKWLQVSVTMIQIVQMVGGLWLTWTAGNPHPASPDCGKWAVEDPISLNAAYFMYFSYFALFAKMFFTKYVVSKSSGAHSKKRVE